MNEIVKKYCPHIHISDYDKWINDYRDWLIESKRKGDKLCEEYFRKSLRDTISFKKESLKNHDKYCLGNLNIFNINN